MSEGAEDSSAGLVAPLHSMSPTVSGATPGEEAVAPAAGGSGGQEGVGPLGLAGLAGTCCICMQVDQVRGCLRSEKICILPILACLLSLALCTAGLKWVFVDKIFEYEPPTHLDPKRIGQDPVLVADPTLGLPQPFPESPTLLTPTTVHHAILSKSDPTVEAFGPLSPRVTLYNPTSALTLRTNTPAWPGPPTTISSRKPGTPTSYPKTTLETEIKFPKFSVTSTTAPVRTSSHERRCPEKEKNYCVNGGTCFTIEVAPGNDRLLCRCLPGYNGNRCQDIVPMKVMNRKQAEELYQKRVLTITGICFALLVVGIMCVVAYCKTKKQRKKLHDRLRQSLRNERNAMATMANGPQVCSPPTESLQLVSARQYVSKNAILVEHTVEKETETSFSATLYTSSTQSSATVTQTSNKRQAVNTFPVSHSETVVSHHRLVPVTSDGSKRAPPSRRGRLDATGCAPDLGGYLRSATDTPDSYKDSPYSERYVSAMTTPSRMSPVELLSPESPKSPPSEMSPPLSSLATSVPSIAISPQGEEERPLLFATPPRLRDKHRQDQNGAVGHQYQRDSAHYNHEAHSPPPSPQRAAQDEDYETTQEDEAAAPQPTKKLADSGSEANRTKVNGHVAHKLEANSESSSESSSSESETEDERVGEDTPFLSIQNPLAAGLEAAAAGGACRPAESSRTNPALRLSAQEDLQARLSSVIVNQDPIAV
ncbi:pro-neuregulin-1, membrane-bound isoform isoform X5 [Arapaima gigas]